MARKSLRTSATLPAALGSGGPRTAVLSRGEAAAAAASLELATTMAAAAAAAGMAIDAAACADDATADAEAEASAGVSARNDRPTADQPTADSHKSAADPMAYYAVESLLGSKLRLHGLSDSRHLNGRVGTCTAFHPHSGRYELELEATSVQAAAQSVRCRRSNLSLASPVEEDAANRLARGGGSIAIEPNESLSARKRAAAERESRLAAVERESRALEAMEYEEAVASKGMWLAAEQPPLSSAPWADEWPASHLAESIRCRPIRKRFAPWGCILGKIVGFGTHGFGGSRFQVVYQDGESEWLSLAELRPLLIPYEEGDATIKELTEEAGLAGGGDLGRSQRARKQRDMRVEASAYVPRLTCHSSLPPGTVGCWRHEQMRLDRLVPHDEGPASSD